MSSTGLFRTIVLMGAGLVGCHNAHDPVTGPPETEADAATESTDSGTPVDAACPPDAEFSVPPCYLIL